MNADTRCSFALKDIHPQRSSESCFVILFTTLLLLQMSVTDSNPVKIYKLTLHRSDQLFGKENVFRERRSVSPNINSVYESAQNLQGQPGQGYFLALNIGEPAQAFNVLVDTGSSNFALAAAPHPDVDRYFNISHSRTLKDLGTKVDVPYTQGDWKGTLVKDVVRITSLPRVSFTANIALITSSDRFFINGSQWQGILGLAYKGIARPDDKVEPFFDSLVRQADVADIFSMRLCGVTNFVSNVSMDGTLIIGGVDEQMYTGALVYVPIRKEWYYEVVITDILVRGTSVGLDCKEYNYDKTIVDSGTTNLRLPTRVFDAVIKLLQNNILLTETIPSTFWTGVNLICLQKNVSLVDRFPPITIQLAYSVNATVNLVMTAREYLRFIPDDLKKTGSKDCYRFSIAPSDTGAVLGATFMEGFYVVFDRLNQRIGFAVSTCPRRRIDGSTVPSVDGPYFTKLDTVDCGYIKTQSSRSVLNGALYAMAGVCCFCAVPLI